MKLFKLSLGSATALLLVSGAFGSDAQSQAQAQAQTPIPYPPYVMAQIDKLHDQGITGKGIKIALIGTGVSCYSGEREREGTR